MRSSSDSGNDGYRNTSDSTATASSMREDSAVICTIAESQSAPVSSVVPSISSREVSSSAFMSRVPSASARVVSCASPS